MKKGDWVYDGCDQIGRVVHQPYESIGRMHIDVAIYDHDGERLGRVSPRMGGPSGFEPACDAQQWFVIEKPDFPLSRFRYVGEQIQVIAPAATPTDGGEGANG